jgi:hypothetical protein
VVSDANPISWALTAVGLEKFEAGGAEPGSGAQALLVATAYGLPTSCCSFVSYSKRHVVTEPPVLGSISAFRVPPVAVWFETSE